CAKEWNHDYGRSW
nr:immunoglobulin heavy chain junction region [Macaca mulatta]MOW50928.1 immunoglobulin heavy chain junction region [Macaca mulatta]